MLDNKQMLTPQKELGRLVALKTATDKQITQKLRPVCWNHRTRLRLV